MSFDEFAAKVAGMAGGIPCAATFTKGFNGAPTQYVAIVEAYPESRVRTEPYEDPMAALAEFAGVLALIRVRHETWLRNLEVASLHQRVTELIQQVDDLEKKEP